MLVKISSQTSRKKKRKLNASMNRIIDDIIERTGMPDTPESRKIVENFYEQADGLLTKDAGVNRRTRSS